MLTWLSGETLNLLLAGLWLTIALTLATSLSSLCLGVWVGTLNLNGSGLIRRMARFYIEIHRNTPALVLIVFWVFALPNLFPAEIRRTLFFDNRLLDGLETWTGLSVPYYTLAAGVALTSNTSAYLAELFRAGVGTIAREHLEAARTLGANDRVLLGKIIIPQGLRGAFPAISTRLIHNMKNTALAAFVSTPEFFHGVQTSISRSFRAVELLSFGAIVYLLLSLLFSALLGRVEARLNRN